jgi:hypothetical protein
MRRSPRSCSRKRGTARRHRVISTPTARERHGLGTAERDPAPPGR